MTCNGDLMRAAVNMITQIEFNINMDYAVDKDALEHQRGLLCSSLEDFSRNMWQACEGLSYL